MWLLFYFALLWGISLSGICEGALLGDVNKDGMVDLTDLNLVRNHFGSAHPAGDANGDGVVDLTDLNAIRNHFGEQAGKTFIAGGPISQNTTWTLSQSPYVIQGVVTVSGTSEIPAILTIEAGVELRFCPGAGIEIINRSQRGGLSARGTQTAPILFTALDPTSKWNGIAWNGIAFSGTSEALSMEHCIVEDARTGLYVTLYSNPRPYIRKITVRRCNNAFWIEDSNLQVEESSVISNEHGFFILGFSEPTILRSRVAQNRVGFVFQIHEAAFPEIHYCDIVDNTLHVDATGSVYEPEDVELVIPFEENWWGTTDPEIIASKIYDFVDGFSSSRRISYIPYLNQSALDAAPPRISEVWLRYGDRFRSPGVFECVVTARDPNGDLLEYRFLLDGNVSQDWSRNNRLSLDTAALAPGLKTVRIEIRDPSAGQDARDVQFYVYRKPLEAHE